MKKRFLASALALVMALSLLPVNALAAEGDAAGNANTDVEYSNEKNGAHLVKSATKVGDTYKIQLESWVTGKVEQTTGSAPLDIVLVLDQSGSMAENNKLDKLKNAVRNFVDTVKKDAADNEVEHRIAIVGFASNRTEGGSNSEDGAWYNTGIFVNGELKNYETYEGDWTNVYLTSDSKPDDDYEYSAYLKSYSIFRTGIEYNAEKQEWGYWSGFWGDKWNTITPKTDANDDNSDHIQVQRRAKAGYIGLTAADYQDALVKSSETSISTAIDNLSASGATRASYGMEMANNVFANNSSEERSRVVVFFTDGEPGQDGYETSEAGRAISKAYATKNTYGAKVFSVGMFDKTPSENSVNFMKYVSSNYPKANATAPSSFFDNWKITPGNKDADKFYMTVENDNLSDVFRQISGSILTSDVKADANTELTDTLSQFFDFDGVAVENGTVTGVTVKKVAYAGNDTWATDGEDITSDVTVHLNGKTVAVRGFDYSDEKNVVTDGTTPSGYKLVVTFNVKPDTNCENWAGSKPYETNNDTATLANDGDTFATVASPKAPVDTYQVTYTFDNSAPNGVNPPKDTRYYISGQQAEVKQPEKSSVDAGDSTYTFNGWKNGNDEVNGEKIDISGNVTLTGTWTKTANKYTVTYALDDASETPPSTAGNLPTDSKKYASGEEYQIDNNYGKTAIDEGGYTYTFSGWKLNGTGNVLTEPQRMGSENVVLKGTWTKTANKYKVTYTDGVENEEVFANVVYPEVTFNTTIPAFNEQNKDATPTRDGYTFTGWTSSVSGITTNSNMPAENVTFTATWTPNTNTGYTVEYYYQKDDGTYPAAANETASRTGTTGATASVTDADKADKENGKYTYDSSNADNVERGTIAADGSLTLKLYFKLNKFDYEIEYYYDGESKPFDKTTNNVPYGTEVSAVADSAKLAAHYSRKSVNPKLPVTIDKAGIVIKVYYTKNPAGDGTFDFNNIDGKKTPAITKTVKGNVGKNFEETFKVTVEPKSDNAKNTMTLASYTGEAKVTYADLTSAFKFAAGDKLTFSAADTYTYTVREVAGKPGRMSYDTTKYFLTIKVELDTEANKYKVTSWKFDANKEAGTPLNIVNTYRAYQPSTPSVTKPALNTDDHYAYVMGYPDGTVQPGGYITRAEASTIFFRLLTDATREEYWAVSNEYTDVKDGDWYNNAISTLSNAGIVSGYPDGTFRPNAPITRAEMSKIIALFAKLDKTNDRFTDIAGHWAEAYIKLAAGNGWIEGYPDGSFRPNQSITRAETVTMINRVLERVPSEEDHLLSERVMLTFPDCKSGQWFYIAIQEATNSHTYERAVTEKNGDEQWIALRDNRDWTKLEY